MPTAKIVIVEDDTRMADIIASMVGLYGYEAIICHDAKAALDVLPRETPGLLLLDLNLPGGMNGIEICRQVKNMPDLLTTPVIIISADDSPETIQEAIEAGVARYLVKPVGLDDLEKAIVQTLREAGR